MNSTRVAWRLSRPKCSSSAAARPAPASPAMPPCAASRPSSSSARTSRTAPRAAIHGLLHSGGRYAVKDPEAAKECVAENAILRRIASDCIEDTGGLFVTTPWDDPAYGDTFVEGCRATGVPVEEIPVAEALRREPRLHPGISRAFTVPDAALDAWKLVWGCARSAQEHGARDPALPPRRRARARRPEGDRRARAQRADRARSCESTRTSSSTRRARGPGRSPSWRAAGSTSSRARGS